jgi:hypothetical protein
MLEKKAQMLRIEYYSAVSLAPDDLALLDIIRECDVLDRDRIVTGFLHYDGRSFHHVMEGPENVLAPMFEALRRVPRHEEVRVSNRSNISKRQHSGFSFQYVASIGRATPTVEYVQSIALVESKEPVDALQT